MPQPIISDSRFLAEVEGNRYALIRLRGSLLHKCLDAQECLRNAMHGFDLVYPTPHLTLCNFRKEANLDEIRSVTSAWATRTPRFDVTILAVSSFPHPHQVIYASVRRNGGILLAHQTLLADVTKNGLLGELRPTERWLPHVSLAYCYRLGSHEWAHASRVLEPGSVSESSDQANEVEIVAYELGDEVVTGTYALRERSNECGG